MSTEENKAVVRRQIEEVVNKHNLAAIDELFTADCINHGTGSGQEIKGPEGMKQFFTSWFAVFPDFHITIDDMVAEGDKVATRMTARGTHKGELMGVAPTGKQITWTSIVIDRFEGGKEAEAWQIIDLSSMMQQLGVIPTPK